MPDRQNTAHGTLPPCHAYKTPHGPGSVPIHSGNQARRAHAYTQAKQRNGMWAKSSRLLNPARSSLQAVPTAKAALGVPAGRFNRRSPRSGRARTRSDRDRWSAGPVACRRPGALRRQLDYFTGKDRRAIEETLSQVSARHPWTRYVPALNQPQWFSRNPLAASAS